MGKSSQKFIGRNRPPRVHISYDLDVNGPKKVELPFVMGVLADLSGKSENPLPAIDERKFLEFDGENFDARMEAIAPRAAFQVDNKVTGEGKLAVDLTFNSMEDFSPDAVARNTEGLQSLVNKRDQLQRLKGWIDGKSKAEKMISELMSDPELENLGGGEG